MRTRRLPVLALTAVALGLALTGGATAGAAAATPQQHQKCTDLIDYAGDPRSNAEINSIGALTGICPPVRHR
jgi:hypothetical protein